MSQNQGKDALKDSTKNQASEKNIHKDIQGRNRPDYKASKKKVQPDDATSDKCKQNTNQVQDTSNDTNKNTEDNENQIRSPVTNNSKKDTDIQEFTQGSKIGSNNKSEMIQDTNCNPDDKLQPDDNRHPDSEENEKIQPVDYNTQRINAKNKDIDIFKNLHKIAIQDQTMK